ncbi:MAG: phage tail assembly protein [Paracoccus sp. (in: a-proteobacteria)]
MSQEPSTTIDQATAPTETVTVELDQPITRGTSKISTIVLRRPNAGSLRGLSLMDIAQMNVTALIKVLPRISDPTLTEQEVAKMDPADLASCAAEVASFLLRKQDRQQYQ